jgi:hypothetical protein
MEAELHSRSRKEKGDKQKPQMHERGPLIDENVRVKICDLGNGCWTHYHFTSRI